MKVLLIIFIVQMMNGMPVPHRAVAEMPSLEVCLERAKEFLQQDPKTLDAIAIAAGCEVQVTGRES